ncbi:MAG: riboflavin kinase [Candidatus Andersenbacteria bacterium]|nr:riboflavin kinase [Candidatus Andersenbacteria bacterium]
MDLDTKHWIEGTVVRGLGKGRELGFPTANLVLARPSEKPREGIWACWVKLEASSSTLYRAVLHVGPRPTIEGASDSVEVHIIGETAIDLYDKKLWFSPTTFLRDIKKFNSLEELTTAIQGDVQQAVLVLHQSAAFF